MWWREAFAPILGTADPARLEPFLQDVLEAESSALCTPSGFDDALAHVLIKWHRADHLAEVLRVMNAIDVYEEVVGVAQSLQQAGVNCHIASNQQAGRARHMSETLNYRTRFTREFYSCSFVTSNAMQGNCSPPASRVYLEPWLNRHRKLPGTAD